MAPKIENIACSGLDENKFSFRPKLDFNSLQKKGSFIDIPF